MEVDDLNEESSSEGVEESLIRRNQTENENEWKQ